MQCFRLSRAGTRRRTPTTRQNPYVRASPEHPRFGQRWRRAAPEATAVFVKVLLAQRQKFACSTPVVPVRPAEQRRSHPVVPETAFAGLITAPASTGALNPLPSRLASPLVRASDWAARHFSPSGVVAMPLPRAPLCRDLSCSCRARSGAAVCPPNPASALRPPPRRHRDTSGTGVSPHGLGAPRTIFCSFPRAAWPGSASHTDQTSVPSLAYRECFLGA